MLCLQLKPTVIRKRKVSFWAPTARQILMVQCKVKSCSWLKSAMSEQRTLDFPTLQGNLVCKVSDLAQPH
ncbi:hypothetical protein CKQ55_30300 (plasmid) [Klebsiella michiganensis]|nr:hypothetical protein CKQ55_30300 [Klebsiella michiganensis]